MPSGTLNPTKGLIQKKVTHTRQRQRLYRAVKLYCAELFRTSYGIDLIRFYLQNGRCHFNPDTVGATDTGYVDIKSQDEDALKQAIANVGPISVAIDASHSSFQFYNRGVYNEKRCSSSQLDHGVLAVGYGTTSDGEDYWLVKNR